VGPKEAGEEPETWEVHRRGTSRPQTVGVVLSVEWMEAPRPKSEENTDTAREEQVRCRDCVLAPSQGLPAASQPEPGHW
jgi:hypothetical protein